ncbi:CDP-glucose 4/6-dehydratase [Synechococcus sp. PROS-7-1]|uniref:CDP-glucose 4,6-dehydratase n=1 Tax=Synechococcus sp. PROS-7-1 TaxID=1442556 RepID=UPI0016447447|nr:CDP-glucose 4,6-dehydratase [Synechococcus sp. PROS-7-1]QNI83941.1 CDP-glucose 4/6-dehydratase [Synechococcus sp. PROS-7-1]
MLDPSFWSGRRVLLTGHTGFKGSWLLLWLQELGAQVWTLALEPEPAPNLFRELARARLPGKAWQHQIGDLADLEALKALVLKAQPEVVFHLAAQPLVRRSYEDPLGTWSTNLMGSLHVLEALRPLQHPCAVVMVTTDKVYENREWVYGYREADHLGGHDPYSASKAAAEIAISSWRSSFCGTGPHQTAHLRIATARAGNVIGGGDWARDRIVPDAMRSLTAGEPIPVRNPKATRPWQHVLEPLAGYLRLAQALLTEDKPPCEPFNFGPTLQSNRSVKELVATILECWPGTWVDQSDPTAPHEASLLHLQIDKAHHRLGWRPLWDFGITVRRTAHWYVGQNDGKSVVDCCLADLQAYQVALKARHS